MICDKVTKAKLRAMIQDAERGVALQGGDLVAALRFSLNCVDLWKLDGKIIAHSFDFKIPPKDLAKLEQNTRNMLERFSR